MPIEVLLLRGINVGGHNKLRMGELKEILAALGARDIITYIQSGNAVYRGTLAPTAISSEIEARQNFRPRAIILSKERLMSAIAANPFPEAVAVPKSLHFYFLDGEPELEPEKLDSAKSADESWQMSEGVFYLHSPGGLAQSRLAEGLDRRIGVAATGRNWNTVAKLAEMVRGLDA